MASSSSPSALPLRSYDVFLSFRGLDTRDNFTAHLQVALKQRGIDTFIDEGIRRGDDLRILLDIIQNSKMAVIIFSENYANSSWCMEELAKIMECRRLRHNKQVAAVVPIFYKVSAGDVRNQTGSFGIPFENQEQIFGREFVHRVPTWKAALTAASNITGYVFPGKKNEPQLITDIANQVFETISIMSPGEDRNLVGIGTRRQHLQKLLCFEDFTISTRMVGVLGMPGIGKTTIANDIYIHKRHLFDAFSFISIDPKTPLASLLDKLLHEILNVDELLIGDPRSAHEVHKNKLCNKRVLIVLDNVSDKDQIGYLLGKPELYGKGSKIVVTTRDKRTIEEVIMAENMYQVPALDCREALQLFSLHAFPALSKPPAEFMDLTNAILDYARGVPLALEFLGYDLRGKGIQRWEYRLHNLECWRDEKIRELLNASFKGLSPEQKEAFLDIACFFRSENADYVRSLLDFRCNGDGDPISVLVDKCLVSISDDRLQMHDLLHKMGKENSLGATNSREAGNQPRLWDPEDVSHVLKHKTGTVEIRGVFLDMSKVEETKLSPQVFENMCNLRYLKLFSSHCSEGCEDDCKFQFPSGLISLPGALTYFHWQGYPLPDLPPNFDPKKLVDLKLPYSQIKGLWEDNKEAEKLRWIDLRHSRKLSDLSKLSNAKNLESLNLQGCSSLTTLCSCIAGMNKLVYLNLRDCTSLTCLPGNIKLESLKTLILSGCSELRSFPEISENIEILKLDGTAIEEVTEFIARLSKLAILDLESCHMLRSLPNCLDNLMSLQKLILSRCSMLENFPEIHNDMKHLEVLLLDETAIHRLPREMKLSSLKTFSFCRAKRSVSDGLLLSPDPSAWQLLRDLYLADCGLDSLPDDVSWLSSLQNLCLRGNNFESLPLSIKDLHHLRWLDLKYCVSLLSLPVLPPNLQCLDAHGCDSLTSVASPLTKLIVAERIHCTFVFTNCFKLNQEAENNIVGHAQIKSLLMANASLSQYHRGCVMESLVDISYPGIEIPPWFSYQRTGSSLKTQLSPHWCDCKFIGFALCTVVSFDDCNDCSNRFSVKCTCEFKNDYGYCISFTCTMKSWAEPAVSGNRSRGIRSDHVFLGYNSCFHITKCYGEDKVDKCGYTEASLNFSVTDGTPRKLDGCKIEKCGFNLFYAPEENDTRLREMWDRIFYQERHEMGNMMIRQSMNSLHNGQTIINRLDEGFQWSKAEPEKASYL